MQKREMSSLKTQNGNRECALNESALRREADPQPLLAVTRNLK